MPNLSAGTKVRALDYPESKFTSSTTFITGFTNITNFSQSPSLLGVIFRVPSSGRVAVHWSAHIEGSPSALTHVSVDVRTGSTLGAGTTVSNSTFSSSVSTGSDVSDIASRMQCANYRLVSGLNPNSEYNAVLEWAVELGGYGNIFYRSILVQPLP